MRTIILLAATLLIVGAAAQTAAPAEKPAPSQIDQGKLVSETSCSLAAIQELRAAVDPNGDPAQQEWHMRAAEAYRQLAELQASC